jgi:hypothetical protein
VGVSSSEQRRRQQSGDEGGRREGVNRRVRDRTKRTTAQVGGSAGRDPGLCGGSFLLLFACCGTLLASCACALCFVLCNKQLVAGGWWHIGGSDE